MQRRCYDSSAFSDNGNTQHASNDSKTVDGSSSVGNIYVGSR
jgi:hypothetical protein